MRLGRLTYHLGLFLSLFTVNFYPSSLYGQQVYYPYIDLDTNQVFHSNNNALLFKTLITLNQAIDTAQKDSLVIIYVECSQFEVDELNDIISRRNKSSRIAYRGDYHTPWIETYFEILKNGITELDSNQKSQLGRVRFEATDPFLGIVSSESFKENLLLKLDEIFIQVPDSSAPVALKAIRSYKRFLVLKQLQSDLYKESDRDVSASFNAANTFEDIADSIKTLDKIHISDSLKTVYGVYREMMLSINKGYGDYRSASNHFERLLERIDYIKSTKGITFWIVEKELPRIDLREGQPNLMGLMNIMTDSHPITRVNFFDSKNNTSISSTLENTKWIKVDLINSLNRIWHLTDYNLNPLKESNIENEDNKIPRNGKSLRLPYGYIGLIANQGILDITQFNNSLINQNLTAIQAGQALGFEAGIRPPDGVMLSIQWAAQNNWINWESKSFYRNYNIVFSSWVPIFEVHHLQSYFGFDYHYASHRISTPILSQFIGEPTDAPIIWKNDAQNIGISARIQGRFRKCYLAAQTGYRWDISDNRWLRDGRVINSDDNVSFSGLYFALSGGLFLGGN